MTRTTSLIFVLMLAAAIPAGCTSDSTPDGSLCEPLEPTPCYIGPPSAGGVGACSPGTAVCAADGKSYGECSGSVFPSFQSCASGVDTDCDGATACSGSHRWSQGLIGQGFKSPFDLGVDKDGNITIAGEFDNILDLGGGELTADPAPMQTDIFVARYDATGKHLWSKKIGGAANQDLYGFASDRSGNIFLTGWSEAAIEFQGVTLSDWFLLKLGPDGEIVWSLPTGGYLAVDGDSNIILAGSFIEPVTFGDKTLTSAGERDAVILKLDPSGTLLWAVSAGGAGSEYLHHVTVDGAGDISVAGQYSGVADLGDGPHPPGATDGNQSAFAAKFDKNGAFLWSRSFVGEYVRLRLLNADKAGNTVLSGQMVGSVDFGGGQVLDNAQAFLTKLDPSGATLFSKGFTTTDPLSSSIGANVAGIAFDGEDNMLVLGSFGPAIDLGGGFALKAAYTAVFVAKYDAAGKIIWGLTPGGGYALPNAAGIGADPMGGAVVTGTYDGGMDFGGGIIYGNPNQDEIFLASLAP